MTVDLLEDDDLLTRLRAADPAAGLDPRHAIDRAAVTRARRRRAAARGGTVAAVALAATLALALAPSGGTRHGGAPLAERIVARAVAASDLPERSIVVIDSDVTVPGELHENRTTWVQMSGDGRPLAVRSLITSASGAHVAAGAEDVTSTDADGGSTLQQFDPTTGKVTTTPGGRETPSVVFEARALLVRAQAGDKDVRLVGEETIGGRRAYRLIVTGVQEPAIRGDHDELLVDTETYAPLELRKHSEGTAVDGKPYTYDLSERIVSRRTLPDTAANRALLRLHGGG
jgi:hypothetical protein